MNDGVVVVSGLIKSKPSGDKPIDETRRIVKIATEIVNTIDKYLLPREPDMISIENLAFMARNTTSLVQLSALNYLVRIRLDERNIPFTMVAPTTLKKFITQKGNADKNLMMMEVYKKYGFESLDDNVCDSFSLAVLAQAVMGSPVKPMTSPEQEVVTLIQKQL
jgi:crossover junction endodeoxyribonuclease RuvC